MMSAYPECYLSAARRHLAEAFDYAVRDCEIGGSEFVSLFSLSQVGAQFEVGNPWAVAGMSGAELVEASRIGLEDPARSRYEYALVSLHAGDSVARGALPRG